jgi:hypothetical protein
MVVLPDGQPTDEQIIERAQELIAHIRNRHITFCAGSRKLEHLLEALMFCRRNIPEGLYIEAGVAMGGSAMLIAIAKPAQATLRLYDVFDLLPAPGSEDGAKAQTVYKQFRMGRMRDPTSVNYQNAASDLLAVVKRNMTDFGMDLAASRIEFFPGLFEDTLHVSEPIAFCHVDCDWYESAKCCIERISDHVVRNGLVMFDDYHSFEGCQKAVDQWLAADDRYRMVSRGWSVAVQRIRS